MLWEAIKLANQSVRRNVLRSILTLLGIVIGVSAVIAMVTIGNGTTQKVTEDLSKLGSNMLVARPGRETFGGGGDVRSFTERNVETLRNGLADVRGIAPTATRAARVVYGAENYDTTVTGTESDFFVVQDWSFERGRPFTDGDIRSASSVCVIGQTVKTVLFGQADPLGLRLRACASGACPAKSLAFSTPRGNRPSARTRTTRWSCRSALFNGALRETSASRQFT
jgi:putative ABC transport system permease protein